MNGASEGASERSEAKRGGACERATSAAERTSERASGTFSTMPFQIDLSHCEAAAQGVGDPA